MALPADVFLGVEVEGHTALVVHKLVMLLQGLTFELEDLLVDLEDSVRLAAELETAEGESGLH